MTLPTYPKKILKPELKELFLDSWFSIDSRGYRVAHNRFDGVGARMIRNLLMGPRSSELIRDIYQEYLHRRKQGGI